MPWPVPPDTWEHGLPLVASDVYEDLRQLVLMTGKCMWNDGGYVLTIPEWKEGMYESVRPSSHALEEWLHKIEARRKDEGRREDQEEGSSG